MADSTVGVVGDVMSREPRGWEFESPYPNFFFTSRVTSNLSSKLVVGKPVWKTNIGFTKGEERTCTVRVRNKNQLNWFSSHSLPKKLSQIKMAM